MPSWPVKDLVCRALAEMGTARSVPALAAMLPDSELSHMARFALERIADPAACAALRDALPKVPARLKAGLIDSLGTRRDAAAVPAIVPLLHHALSGRATHQPPAAFCAARCLSPSCPLPGPARRR